MSKGLSRPLHPRPGTFASLDPRPVFRHRLSTKAEMSALPLETHRPALESTWAFALDPRGICGETRRAGRLPCGTWPARNEEHPSHIVPLSGCGMSFVRASGSRGFRPAALSRAPCSGWQHRAHGPVRHFVKRWQRSCSHRPRAWPTCWRKRNQAVPRTQRFCKRRVPNSLKSEPHFLPCSGGSLDSLCITARRRAEPRHPFAE